MAVITVLDTKNEKLNKVKAFSTVQGGKALDSTSEKIKRTGNYLYVDTANEGIKRVVNGDGGYLAFLDYGKVNKVNKKTGQLELKQDKTTRHVQTEREAKALRRQAEEIRAQRSGKGQVVQKPRSVLFGQAVEEFYTSPAWGSVPDSEKHTFTNYFKHMDDYFKNFEPKDITVLDIEGYYDYQLKHGSRLPVKKGQDNSADKKEGISVNSLPKHKTAMKKLWQYFIDSGKYGVQNNLAALAKIPKVEIKVGKSTIKVSRIPHQAHSLTLEELNYTLNDAVQHEFDRSVVLMIALASIGSLRHGETIGLEVGKFLHNELMNIPQDSIDYSGYDREYYEKNEELMFIDNQVARRDGKDIEKLPKFDKIRVAAAPECLRRVVAYAMEQRQQVYSITGKSIDKDEKIYLPLLNAIRGNSFTSNKMGKKWNEYQIRRNKRMIKLGLKPIQLITYHELRHTHNMIMVKEVSSRERSLNMGHELAESDRNVNSQIYLNDRRPDRSNIIAFYDQNIHLNWDKALNKPINTHGCQVAVNGSGHLVISDEVAKKRKAQGKRGALKEEEYEALFRGETVD